MDFPKPEIVNYPVTVQYIDIYYAIWGNNIAGLKEYSTGKKPICVEGGQVKVPRGIIKLQKYLFVTDDIIFVNGIPSFISINRKIIFTLVNHLTDSKSNTVFKSLKKIYIYYTKPGLRIITLHGDGEFAPLQALIHNMTGRPLVNLESASERVPDINRKIQVAK